MKRNAIDQIPYSFQQSSYDVRNYYRAMATPMAVILLQTWPIPTPIIVMPSSFAFSASAKVFALSVDCPSVRRIQTRGTPSLAPCSGENILVRRAAMAS